jgi:hypothetical protein
MTAGKVTLFAVLTGAILSATTLAAYFEILTPLANAAANVSTSVTVLNTPPQWDTFSLGVDQGFAHELTPSSTSTPTNTGTTITFTGQATDSGNDAYFLIICNATSTAPTPHDNAPPTCNGGNAFQFAISATTTSGVAATAATTTIDNISWQAEKYDWTGWVCDAHVPGAQCNQAMKNAEPGDPNNPQSASPFVVNHPPQFTAISNNGPQNPGAGVTWTATATDTDHIRGVDPLTLYVCKTAGFSTSTGCTAGAWATSTPFSVANPATTSVIKIPTPDGPYNAFVFITDQNGLAATTTFQGFNSSYNVNDVAPTIDPTTISLINYDASTTLTLLNPAASTSNYKVEFIVTSNNSCKTQSNGNQIVSATTTVFRSGVGVAACQTPGQFDSNKCYPSNGGGYTNFICTQDTSGAVTGNGCTGTGDATVGWYCTFSLWFNADPTDVNSQFSAQNWLAGVQVADHNFATSTEATSTTGAKLDSFLAFSVSTTSIAYGGLQPGQSNSPIIQTTDLQEQGNIGLNENLYGDTMCTQWTTPDSCDHYYGSALATSTIPVANQKFATSSLAYASIYTTALTSSSSPVLDDVRVLKTTATTSIQTKNTFWGIAVPAAVTLSGNYSGQDTITAVESSSAFW